MHEQTVKRILNKSQCSKSRIKQLPRQREGHTMPQLWSNQKIKRFNTGKLNLPAATGSILQIPVPDFVFWVPISSCEFWFCLANPNFKWKLKNQVIIVKFIICDWKKKYKTYVFCHGFLKEKLGIVLLLKTSTC